ncbi:MAG: glycoside hydrolase family 13 protein [Eubacteriales bacterium]|nr:glycoside hydrolase family 13 protein [Eubacteriales bacterium]
MNIYHNSRNILYRSPFGACECNSKIYIRLDVYDPIPGLIVYIFLFSSKNGPKRIEMKKIQNDTNEDYKDNLYIYTIELDSGNEPSLLWYSFILQNYNETYFYGNNEKEFGGEGSTYSTNPRGYQITIYKNQESPNWYKNGICYQIFTDRFARGKDYLDLLKKCNEEDSIKNHNNYLETNWYNTPHYEKDEHGNVNVWQYFGGTLSGIIEKIPYLKSLGVNIIYLNPIFKAYSNHKYNTYDYMSIDPHFGNEKIFKELINECKKNDIHIILDGVFSHTGKDSLYFNDAIKSKKSPYYSWYTFSEYPNEYDCWWGVNDLPNVNELDENFSNFIYKDKNSVIKHYLKMGISGFRLDVADELPDEFIKGIRKSINECGDDKILLGEVWEDASNKKAYDVLREYFYGEELHSVMNYCFKNLLIDFFLGKINAKELYENIYNIMEHYPKDAFYSNLNIIGSHDTIRVLSALGEAPEEKILRNDYFDKYKNFKNIDIEKKIEKYKLNSEKYNLSKARLKCLSLIQFTLPGVPCIYYGDEAGVEGYSDPYNRKTYPWGKEDTDILSHYKEIALMRNSIEAFTLGTYEPMYFGEHVYACKRTYKNDCYLILVNRAIFPGENESIHYELKYNDKIKIIDETIGPLNYKIIKI